MGPTNRLCHQSLTNATKIRTLRNSLTHLDLPIRCPVSQSAPVSRVETAIPDPSFPANMLITMNFLNFHAFANLSPFPRPPRFAKSPR